MQCYFGIDAMHLSSDISLRAALLLQMLLYGCFIFDYSYADIITDLALTYGLVQTGLRVVYGNLCCPNNRIGSSADLNYVKTKRMFALL
jgi:hypothetical protein